MIDSYSSDFTVAIAVDWSAEIFKLFVIGSYLSTYEAGTRSSSLRVQCIEPSLIWVQLIRTIWILYKALKIAYH